MSDDARGTIVQYVVVREDLAKKQDWPAGAVIAQCCHASSAAIWENMADDVTQTYLHPDNIKNMHKVVLKCKNANQLTDLAATLTANGVPNHLWMELPEDIPTALATKPVYRNDVTPYFKKMQLYRDAIGSKKGGNSPSNSPGNSPQAQGQAKPKADVEKPPATATADATPQQAEA